MLTFGLNEQLGPKNLVNCCLDTTTRPLDLNLCWRVTILQPRTILNSELRLFSFYFWNGKVGLFCHLTPLQFALFKEHILCIS